MATLRDSSRRSLHRHLHPPGSSSRYAAFDGSTENGPRSSRTLSNKWEIALVTIIVAAGIVITTIAAIKAQEKPTDDDYIKSANDLDYKTTTNHTHRHQTPKYSDKKKKSGTTSTTEASLSTAPHLIPGNYITSNYNNAPTPPSKPNQGLGIAGIRIQTPTEPDLPEMIETTDKPVTLRTMKVSRPDPIIPVDKSDDFNGKLFFDDTYANFYAPDYETPDYDPMNKFRQPSPAASEDVASRTMLSGHSVQEMGDPIASSESIHPINPNTGSHHVVNTNGGMINPNNPHHDGLPGFPPPRGSFINSDHSRTAELAADGAGFIIEDPYNNFGSFMDSSSHVIDRSPKTRYSNQHTNSNQMDMGEGDAAPGHHSTHNRFSPRLVDSKPHSFQSHPHLNSDLNGNLNDNNNQGTRFNNQFPVYSPASVQTHSPPLSTVQSSTGNVVGQASTSSSSSAPSSGLQKLPVFITAAEEENNNNNNQGSAIIRNRNTNQDNRGSNYGSGYTQSGASVGHHHNNHGSFYHQLQSQSAQQQPQNQMLSQSQSAPLQSQNLPQIPLGMPIQGLLMSTLSNNHNVNHNNNNYPSDNNQFNTYHSSPPQSPSTNLMSASLAQSTSSNLPGVTSFSKPAPGSQVVEKLSAAAQSIAASFIPPSLFPRRLGHLLPASLFNPAAVNNNQRFDSLPTVTHENYANRYKRSLPYKMREIKTNFHPTMTNFNGSDAKLKEMTASESGYFNFEEDDDHFRPNIPPPMFDPTLSSPFDQRSSSSDSRRGTRRRGRARSISRNAFAGEESKKSYGILGSGNFEVIRGGIYGDEGGESSESYRTHRNPPPPPPIDDYDDATSNRKRYSFSSEDSDSDYFAPKEGHGPLLGFQGYDNFQLASNQEEDKSDLDKSASVPIIKAIHRQGSSPHPVLRSNAYSSHTGTVLLDSDQDLMADS